MTPLSDGMPGGLASLARPGGTFAMLAIDQRETLRTLLAEALDGPVGDDEMVRFKLEVVRRLGPLTSAVLIDTEYGLDPLVRDGASTAGHGLIVSADRFVQDPGGPVEWVHLDDDAGRRAVDAGADALKLLVPWRHGREEDERARLVEGFMAMCRRHGLLSVVEGVVRGPRGTTTPLSPEEFEEGWLEAAAELCAFDPDLYKAEVPSLGAKPDGEIEVRAREMTRLVGRPWVVLSAGVPLERFEDAARASFRGGASGFLAGRGIWRPALVPRTRVRKLEEVVLPRLQRLVAAVDDLARPWWEARGDGASDGVAGPRGG